MLWKLSFEFYALWFALLNTTVTKHKCLQKEICNARVVLRFQCISVIKLTFYELVNRMCGLLWYFVVQLQCKYTLQWRHNGCDGVSNHQPHVCLLNRLFRCRSKKTSKLRVTGLCVGNSPVNSPHKWPVTRKMFPFQDAIMQSLRFRIVWDWRTVRFLVDCTISAGEHWKENVVILTKFQSLAALEVVILATSTTANDENLIKIIFLFHWRQPRGYF